MVGLSLKGLRTGMTACWKAWNREEEDAFRACLARAVGRRVGGDRTARLGSFSRFML